MDKPAKRDFGSFHASNVAELLAIPENDYVSPSMPFTQPVFQDFLTTTVDKMQFGKQAKRDLFFLEEESCFLNHGAFGAVLKHALKTVHKWQEHCEKQPLRHLDRNYFPLSVHVIRRLAAFVGCNPTDLALITNATFGTNSVLSSFLFQPGDVILTFNITYGAVKKLVKHICAKTGAVNREAMIQFPVSGKEQLIGVLTGELEREDVKFVIIDHIPSNTPIVMPVAEMIQACRKAKARVLIDGAHALGTLPLNLADLDPDYYISNAHKWFCCPKGVAFLYVRQNLQHEVRPAVVSHGFGSGFNSEFSWTGLQDYSPVLSLHAVLDFWLSIGPDKIRAYMRKLAHDGAELLVRAWGSGLAAPVEMFGAMVLIELPPSIQAMYATIDYNAAESIQNSLFHNFNIEVPVKSIDSCLYVRISAHIHNEISDYEKLAKAVLKLAEKE